MEIACWNGAAIRVAFALDTCDREVMAWCATTGGISGEMIRDLHQTPSLRNVPIETLVFQVIQDGGPILYHNDSEEQQRSFESSCSKFRRFLEGRSSVAPAKRRWK